MGKRVEGSHQSLVDWSSSDAIREGVDQWNTLKVVAEGPQLRYYVNNQLLETVQDAALTTGQIGLFAYDAESSTDPDIVQFDNIRVTTDITDPAGGDESPVVVWAHRGGGEEFDEGNYVISDQEGNCLVTGTFQGSADFADYTLISEGDKDVFLAKYNGSGHLLCAKRMGGPDIDDVVGVSTDALGNVYLAGDFIGTATFGSTQLVSEGDSDIFNIFIAKCDPAGNFIWAIRAGGVEGGWAACMETDVGGNSYVIWNNMTYNLSSGEFDYDIFLNKFDTYGNRIWEKRDAQNGNAWARGMSLDCEGNMYVTGDLTDMAQFDDKMVLGEGDDDIFVVKYLATGEVAWVKGAGGSERDRGFEIAANACNQIVVTGYFKGDVRFESECLSSRGGSDIFLAAYDGSGGLLWVEQGGGDGTDVGYGLDTDDLGQIFLIGQMGGSAYLGDQMLSGKGGADIVIGKYDASGEVVWAKNMGGADWDIGSDICRASEGEFFFTGKFSENISMDGHDLNGAGKTEMFIAKIVTLTTNVEAITGNNFLPDVFELFPNYPNPFNATTTITYYIPHQSRVTITIHDILGQDVVTLVDEVKPSGMFRVEWDGKNSGGDPAATGLYICSMKTGQFSQSTKLMLLK